MCLFLCQYYIVLLNYLSMFSCSSWSFSKTATLNSLLGKSQISISLRLVTRKLLWYLGGAVFPRSLMFLEALHPYLHHFLQSLLSGFRRGIPSVSLVRDSEAFSELLLIHLLHTSCSPCGSVLRPACLLYILQMARLDVEGWFSFCFPKGSTK